MTMVLIGTVDTGGGISAMACTGNSGAGAYATSGSR